VEVIQVKLDDLIPYARNARTHSPEQVAQIAASIREFGFTNPVLLREDNTILAGHGRVLAARKLGLVEAPCIYLSHLTEQQARAYVIADNKLALNAGWDDALLDIELADLIAAGFDVALTGFDVEEIDALARREQGEVVEDEVPEPPANPTTKPGDLWLLGEHRLLCGDSTNADDVAALFDSGTPSFCLTDPPYGLGETASDKNNYNQYDDTIENLRALIKHAIEPIVKRMRVILTPGNKNQYEYPRPTWTMAWFAPTGVGRGPWGFCCWQPILCYGKDPKLATGKGSHPDALVHQERASCDAHPCAKPMKFWAWLLVRVSNAGESVYDPFIGSGTTLIAAEQLGRKCYGMEIDPRYCDVIVKRWETLTGRKAELQCG